MPEFYLLAKKTKDSKPIQIKDHLSISMNKDNYINMKYVEKSKESKTLKELKKKQTSDTTFPTIEELEKPLEEPLEETDVTLLIICINKQQKLMHYELLVPRENFNILIENINIQENEQFNPNTISLIACHTDIKQDTISENLHTSQPMEESEIEKLLKTSLEETIRTKEEEADTLLNETSIDQINVGQNINTCIS